MQARSVSGWPLVSMRCLQNWRAALFQARAAEFHVAGWSRCNLLYAFTVQLACSISELEWPKLSMTFFLALSGICFPSCKSSLEAFHAFPAHLLAVHISLRGFL